MPDNAEPSADLRVLILTPTGKDAVLASSVLRRMSAAETVVCDSVDALCDELAGGAGAVIIAEEALPAAAIARLCDALAGEPPWSELPIFVLRVASASRAANTRLMGALEPLRNVTLLDRPLRIEGFTSAVRAALRARRRQYEIRDLMAELQRALRTRDEFVAAVSHELRTPLNVILGRTRSLGRHAHDPARVAHAVDIIDRNANILWQLVEDLLTVARGAGGGFQIKMAPVDLNAVVRAAVEMLRPTADARAVVIEHQLPADPVQVRGDDVRLQQVVWNLVWNAIKFTPADGRVTVSVTRGGAYATIAVTDTGIGIDAALLPHIFEPFKQGTQGSVDPHRGLGLGLAIVRHLVELHGGRVTAASDGFGRGATFLVRLPAGSRASSTAAGAPGEARASGPAATPDTSEAAGSRQGTHNFARP